MAGIRRVQGSCCFRETSNTIPSRCAAIEGSYSDSTFTLNSVLPGDYPVVAIQKRTGLPWLSPAVFEPCLRADESGHRGAPRKI